MILTSDAGGTIGTGGSSDAPLEVETNVNT